jgi:ABC-2 type transport system permease protein
MRQSFAIAWLQTKLTLKSKGSVFSMIVLPLLLTLVFGFLTAGGGSSDKGAIIPVAVADQDDSFLSGQLIDMLKAESNLRVTAVEESQITRLFTDKKVVSVLVIPAGFQKDVTAGATPELKVETAPDSNVHETFTPILGWQLPRLVQDYQLALRQTGGQDEAKVQAAYKQIAAQRTDVASTVDSRKVAAKKVELAKNPGETAGSHASVGFTISFVMMLVFMMSGVILGERQTGTWGRLLTTPNSRAAVMFGYLLSFFLSGMIQFGILIGATRLFFHINWGPLLPLTLMATVTVLCASGMGLFLAGLVKTREQQSSIGILFVNATSMLGGVYWDLSMTSKTMQKVAYLTPQAWAIDGFNEVMYHGARLSYMVLPLVVLLAVTAVFMTAGLLRIRYE